MVFVVFRFFIFILKGGRALGGGAERKKAPEKGERRWYY